jgi:hypothetical protein
MKQRTLVPPLHIRYTPAEDVVEKLNAPKKLVHGPKVRVAVTSRDKEPDEVILEVRRLRETHGMTQRRIAQTMFERYGVLLNLRRIWAIYEYETRAHLVPTAGRKEPYLQPQEKHHDQGNNPDPLAVRDRPEEAPLGAIGEHGHPQDVREVPAPGADEADGGSGAGGSSERGGTLGRGHTPR